MAKEEVRINIAGITDGNSLEKMLGIVKGVYFVKANIAEKQVIVWFNNDLVSLTQIKDEIIDQGYEVK